MERSWCHGVPFRRAQHVVCPVRPDGTRMSVILPTIIGCGCGCGCGGGGGCGCGGGGGGGWRGGWGGGGRGCGWGGGCGCGWGCGFGWGCGCGCGCGCEMMRCCVSWVSVVAGLRGGTRGGVLESSLGLVWLLARRT